MATLAVEVNDAGLLALRAGSKGLRRREGGAGFAVFEGSRLLVGEDARLRRRLLPRTTTSRFWEDLDTTPLGRPFPEGVTAADFAHAHLQDLWARERGVRDVILTVSGSWSERALGVLLGITRALGMPTVGLVDAAVAAASDRPGRRMLHLDLSLHRTVVSDLGRLEGAEGPEVARGRVESLAHGLLDLRDGLARRIGELFVQTTRFDPFHDAATEQAVYDAVDSLLVRLREEPESTVVLASGHRTHEVKVSRELAVRWAEASLGGILDLVRRLAAPAPYPAEVLLSGRAALWPGLLARLEAELGLRPVVLSEDAALEGALRAHALFRSLPGAETLPFRTRLPVLGPRSEAEPPSPARPFATHLVRDGLTWPIGAEPIVLGEGPTIRVLNVEGRALVEVEEGAEVSLNGKDLAGGAPLRAGDRLCVAGRELLLIAMAPPGGSSGAP